MRFANCDLDMQLMMVNHDFRWPIQARELRCYNYATTMGNVHYSSFITNKVSIDFQFFGIFFLMKFALCNLGHVACCLHYAIMLDSKVQHALCTM
jgi:hypothetical protein